jgi:hypothetical protein
MMLFWVMWLGMIDAQMELMCHGLQRSTAPRE